MQVNVLFHKGNKLKSLFKSNLHFPFTQINYLMLFREIIDVQSENHTKSIKNSVGKVIIEAAGTCRVKEKLYFSLTNSLGPTNQQRSMEDEHLGCR